MGGLRMKGLKNYLKFSGGFILIVVVGMLFMTNAFRFAFAGSVTNVEPNAFQVILGLEQRFDISLIGVVAIVMTLLSTFIPFLKLNPNIKHSIAGLGYLISSILFFILPTDIKIPFGELKIGWPIIVVILLLATLGILNLICLITNKNENNVTRVKVSTKQDHQKELQKNSIIASKQSVTSSTVIQNGAMKSSATEDNDTGALDQLKEEIEKPSSLKEQEYKAYVVPNGLIKMNRFLPFLNLIVIIVVGYFLFTSIFSITEFDRTYIGFIDWIKITLNASSEMGTSGTLSVDNLLTAMKFWLFLMIVVVVLMGLVVGLIVNIIEATKRKANIMLIFRMSMVLLGGLITTWFFSGMLLDNYFQFMALTIKPILWMPIIILTFVYLLNYIGTFAEEEIVIKRKSKLLVVKQKLLNLFSLSKDDGCSLISIFLVLSFFGLFTLTFLENTFDSQKISFYNLYDIIKETSLVTSLQAAKIMELYQISAFILTVLIVIIGCITIMNFLAIINKKSVKTNNVIGSFIILFLTGGLYGLTFAITRTFFETNESYELLKEMFKTDGIFLVIVAIIFVVYSIILLTVENRSKEVNQIQSLKFYKSFKTMIKNHSTLIVTIIIFNVIWSIFQSNGDTGVVILGFSLFLMIPLTTVLVRAIYYYLTQKDTNYSIYKIIFIFYVYQLITLLYSQIAQWYTLISSNNFSEEYLVYMYTDLIITFVYVFILYGLQKKDSKSNKELIKQ